ncbi:hypothetical protein ACLB2K_066530 [Fragaria x ananassa]
MAEALVSVLLEQLASIIHQLVEQHVKLVVNVEKDVANLTHNFRAIEAVLKDAEERQVKEASVKLWLDDLKDVSNEMEDVLDDWNTEILRLHIEKKEKEESGNAVDTTKKKPFDELNIAEDIIGQLDGNVNSISNNLEACLQCVHKSIEGKKFLLVLDDVWNQDYRKWEKLKLVLQNGDVGSKIVVTTRKEEVASMMGAADNTINLKVLSDENCWLLFSRIAFTNRNQDECKILEPIGREIVKKCKGLPLVAKTLGGLMSYKKTRKEWQDVLSNEAWELDTLCDITSLNREFVSQLKCVRTLNLSNNRVQQLPEEVGGLVHLSYLEELPQGMGKLTNLRYLRVKNTLILDDLKLPKSLVKLTSLQTLDQVNIFHDGFKASDLRNMDQLQGKLAVRWRELVNDAAREYAELVNLANKKHLVSLTLSLMEWDKRQYHPGRNAERVAAKSKSGSSKDLQLQWHHIVRPQMVERVIT